MNDKQTTFEQSNETQTPVADALIEAAMAGAEADYASDMLDQAFDAYREGKISGPEYAELSQRYGFDQAMAESKESDALKAVPEYDSGKKPSLIRRIAQSALRR